MHEDFFSEFQELVEEVKGFLYYHLQMGVEIPSTASDGQEMSRILEVMIENLSVKNKPSHPDPITLEGVRRELGDCTRCELSTSRKNIVFGKGNPYASLVFVGEAPGKEEDLAGEPFVGEAGQLLTRIIHAINLRREDVYITNVIKCRPPRNRDPEPGEVQACFPFLQKQLQAIRPRIICGLGNFAAQSLLETTEKISSLRGKMYELPLFWVVPTFHPASLLRNPQWKREVWHDVQLIQKFLEGSD